MPDRSTTSTPPPPAVVAAANTAVDAMLDAEGDDLFPASFSALADAELAAIASPAQAETPAADPEVAGEAADDVADAEPTDGDGGDAAQAQDEAGASPPAAPIPPTEDPRAAELRQQEEASRAAAVADYTKWETDFAAVEASLSDPKFDPLSREKGLQPALKAVATGMKFLKAGLIDLAAQQAALTTPPKTTGDFWQQFAEAHPEVGARGQKIFNEEMAKVRTKYPNSPSAAVRLLATEKWESRLAQIRAQKTPPATPAKPLAAATPPAPAARPKPGTRPTTTRAPAPRAGESESERALREVGSVSQLLD